MAGITIPESVPDAKSLQKSYSRYSTYLEWLLGAIIVAIGWLVIDLILVDKPNPWVYVVVVVLAWYLSCRNILPENAVRLEEATPAHLGKYTKVEVENLVNDVLRPFKHLEIPAVYIVKSKDILAQVVDTWLFNFVKPINAVYISSMLFHILKESELRTTISHELGHFYHYIPLVGHHGHRGRADFFRYLFGGFLAVKTWYWLLSIYSGTMLTTLIYIKGAFFYFLILLLYCFPHFRYRRMMEYLSDLFSARQWGKLTMINNLLIIVKGCEIREIIDKKVFIRLQLNSRLPVSSYTHVLEKVFDALPNRLLNKGEEDEIIERVLVSDDAKKFEKHLSEEERELKKTFARTLPELLRDYELKVIDWNLFDFDKRDFRINKTEYPFLLQTIIENPGKQLFNAEGDNVRKARSLDHPAMRDRILFLEKNCRETFPGTGAEDSEARVAALRYDPADIKMLLDALQHEKPGFRSNAAIRLGQLQDFRAVMPLIKALNDSNAQVRWEVVEALRELGDSRAMEPLAWIARKDPNDAIRKASISAIEHMTSRPYREVQMEYRDQKIPPASMKIPQKKDSGADSEEPRLILDKRNLEKRRARIRQREAEAEPSLLGTFLARLLMKVLALLLLILIGCRCS